MGRLPAREAAIVWEVTDFWTCSDYMAAWISSENISETFALLAKVILILSEIFAFLLTRPWALLLPATVSVVEETVSLETFQ